MLASFRNQAWSYSFSTPEIAAQTGPLDPLRDKRILLLTDVENLSYSAKRQLGHKMSYTALTHLLMNTGSACFLHAFFSSRPGNHRREQYFDTLGWTVHVCNIEVIKTHRGIEKLANADSLLTFWAGVLCSRTQADVIALASGDGTLVCDLAKAIAELPTPRQVVTLSLGGYTSWRLNAARNLWIHANIEIGRDCLRSNLTALWKMP